MWTHMRNVLIWNIAEYLTTQLKYQDPSASQISDK